MDNPNVEAKDIMGLTPKRFKEWLPKASRRELESVLQQTYEKIKGAK